MDAKFGSGEWWEEQADKVIGIGLNVLQTKLSGVDSTKGSNAPVVSASTGSTKWLPYAIGAVAIGGIVLILSKR